MRDPSDELDELDKRGLRRRLRTIDSPQQPQIEVEGSPLINFSSNDYLGLANHPFLKKSYQESIERHGVGSGASRLISGTMRPHTELEQQLASIKDCEAALTFSSGFATASGSIPIIAGKGDFIILDKLCHASLIDGAKMSGAPLRVFPHNDLDRLATHLSWATEKKGPKSRILIITESVFSMDGDLAPLREIVALKERFGALLLVDEAHAFGILGPQGIGLAGELGIGEAIDFQMGTFSKAIGLSGGYLSASQKWIDLLINRARSFIYSTAPSPALAETIGKALELVTGNEGERLRNKLWNNVNYFDRNATSAIIPWVIGENEETLALSKVLLESGYLVPAIRFPTVPRGTARLRITFSSLHTQEEIAGLREILDRKKGHGESPESEGVTKPG